MRSAITTGILALWLSMSACSDDRSLVQKSREDDVTSVADDDPAMLAAFEQARKTLDGFLKLAASPAPGTEAYGLKVAVSDDGGTEYFWVTPFTVEGNSFSGRINNTPRVVSNVEEGELIKFDRSKVVDWVYQDTKRNRMYGNFTACALLTHEDPADAAAFKAEYGLRCDI